MPVVTFAEADPVTVSGLDLDTEHVTTFDLADPIRVYGLPMVARTPDPTPQSAPDAVRAEVLDFSGAFVRHLDVLKGLRWLDEHNTSGSGSIDMDRYDQTTNLTTVSANLVTVPSGAGGSTTGWGPPGFVDSVASPGGSPPAATSLHVLSGPSAGGLYYDLYHDPINPGAGPQTVRVSLWARVMGVDGTSDVRVYRSDGVHAYGSPTGSYTVMSNTVLHVADGWQLIEAEFDTTSAQPQVHVLASANSLSLADVNVYVNSFTVQTVTHSTTTLGVGELDPGDQIKIYVGTRSVFRLVLDAEPGYRIDGATGLRTDAWAGLGALGVLNSGMCIPEYGWRPEGTEERSFDYGSNPSIGGWLVPSEWRTPVGKLVRKSWRWTYKKRHLPKGWPDKKAQWLWWRNPDATNVANEVNYFRSSFIAPSAGRYRFSVCGDDTLEFQVDGEIRATTGPGGWRKTTKIVLHLSAGVHYMAAKVMNTSGSAGNQNRSGFLCSVARINGDGDLVTVARRTTPSTWTVRRQLTTAPGWYAAQILRQLVAEQQARGCAGHSGVTFGFTTAADSYGVPWAGRQELAVTVGTQALDYVQQMVETGLDVVMSPDLSLNVYRTRGADRSGWVRLNQHDTHAMDESGTQPPSIRNTLYARALTGWAGVTHAASIAANGIREAMISLGSSRSLTQTAAALAAMLPDMAAPPRTVEIRISGATGTWQPYRDFYVSDWVSYKAAGWSTWHRMRVMSIGGEVNPAGHPDWTIQLYEG